MLASSEGHSEIVKCESDDEFVKRFEYWQKKTCCRMIGSFFTLIKTITNNNKWPGMELDKCLGPESIDLNASTSVNPKFPILIMEWIFTEFRSVLQSNEASLSEGNKNNFVLYKFHTVIFAQCTYKSTYIYITNTDTDTLSFFYSNWHQNNSIRISIISQTIKCWIEWTLVSGHTKFESDLSLFWIYQKSDIVNSSVVSL